MGVDVVAGAARHAAAQPVPEQARAARWRVPLWSSSARLVRFAMPERTGNGLACPGNQKTRAAGAGGRSTSHRISPTKCFGRSSQPRRTRNHSSVGWAKAPGTMPTPTNARRWRRAHASASNGKRVGTARIPTTDIEARSRHCAPLPTLLHDCSRSRCALSTTMPGEGAGQGAPATSPLPGIRHRGPRLLRRQRRALLQKLDRMLVGRAHERHHSVARRPVDGHSRLHQPLA